MEILRASIIALIILVLGSCQKKPTACVNIDDAVEAGALINITSCSEDYEFLTWKFDDGVAVVGDEVQRTFTDESAHTLTLTAYAKNGYRSDETIVDFRSSYRYVDYIEVIGDSPFTRFEVKCFSTIKATEAEGSFTNQSPYVYQVYPEQEIRILPEITKVDFEGVKAGGGRTFIGSQTYNFDSVKDNPIVLVGDSYELRIFWTFAN